MIKTIYTDIPLKKSSNNLISLGAYYGNQTEFAIETPYVDNWSFTYDKQRSIGDLIIKDKLYHEVNLFRSVDNYDFLDSVYFNKSHGFLKLSGKENGVNCYLKPY